MTKNKIFLTSILLFLLFPFSKSFGEATLTHVQTVIFDDESNAKSQNRQIAGIEFNKDGTKLFTSSAQPDTFEDRDNGHRVNEFNLSTPYDISTRTYAGDGERCNLDEIPKENNQFAAPDNKEHTVYDLELSHDGTKLFVAARVVNSREDDDDIYRYDLSVPYDISTCQFAQQTTDLDDETFTDDSDSPSEDIRLQGLEFNNDGTKVFLMWFKDGSGGAKLLEYTLSTPYDITSLQLVTTAGIELGTSTTADVSNPAGMRFSADGKRIFIMSHTLHNQGISQISLTNAFDTSSFVIDGKFNLKTSSPQNLQPRGVGFNSSGLKLYIGNDFGHNSFDQIMEYDLVCPFTIFSETCPPIVENKDRTGMAIAQIEIAKRTIDHSVDSALNRLKWIRRNKDKQNLTNFNIDINFTNQKLASLTQAIKVSTLKNEPENKDQDVFYWSEGSIAVGKVGDTDIASSRKIGTNAITLGMDKLTKTNGIKGLALRFGKNHIDVGSAGSNLNTDTYNITYYGTSLIKDTTRFLDTVFGYGKLSSELFTVIDSKHLTANRSGEQIYGSVKLKDEIKKDKIVLIPSGQVDFGHTVLNEYTEAGIGAIAAERQHVRSKKLRAAMAMVEDKSNNNLRYKRHAKIEYLADIDRSSNFKYSYTGDSTSSFNDTLHSDALHNLNGEIGIDLIFPNSYSIFLIYERNQALGSGHTDKINITIGYLPGKNTNYAFKIVGSENLMSKFEIKKNMDDYNFELEFSEDLSKLNTNREAIFNLNKVF